MKKKEVLGQGLAGVKIGTEFCEQGLHFSRCRDGCSSAVLDADLEASESVV